MSFPRKSISISLLAAILSGSASADFVGLNIGASHWTPDLTGSFSSGSSDAIQLSNDLGFSDQTSSSLSLSFEHPIPLLPNFKYQTTDLNASSSSNLSSPITFGNTDYAGQINSTLDLSHNDIVLYYEVLDNWINIDIGLDLKTFDGKVSINGTEGIESFTVDETVPMLFLSARFNLPLTGFYVGAHIQPLSIDGDNSAEDTVLMLGYESSFGLGIEGGYKTFSLELNDASNLNTNIEYDGLFLNGYFHF